VTSEPARIEFERSGGFANVRLRTTLEAAELHPDEAAELERVAREQAGAGPAPAAGADRFQYDIGLVRGDERITVTLHEDQVPDGLRPLIDRLVERARRR